jgi:uncharacterized membrane protein YphA (DoxX/SURF4 family)
MFPPGLPGAALLLLRASVAMALAVQTYAHGPALAGWAPPAALLISLAISVGYLTPLAAAAAFVFQALLAFAFAAGVDAALVSIVFCADATALALLGPGAYSLDSRRFGRRLVVLPPP